MEESILSYLLRQTHVDRAHEERGDDGGEQQAGCAAIGEIEHGNEVEAGPWTDDAAIEANETNKSVECPGDGGLEAELLHGRCIGRSSRGRRLAVEIDHVLELGVVFHRKGCRWET